MKKQVSFQTFSYFYKKAQHCADKESFIEEAMSLDHDDWALGYSADEIYITSKRTLLAWEKGERKISDMDRLLISYTVFTDVSYISNDILIV